MAISTQAFTATTTAQKVTNPDTGNSITFPASATQPVPVCVDNTLGTGTVYWGGPDVTTATGSVVAVGAKEYPILCPNDDLYLIAGADCVVRVIAGRQ